MKIFYFIAFCIVSNLSYANSLTLLKYPDMFGQNWIYIKNSGASSEIVLTENLVQAKVDFSVEIQVPFTFVKINGEEVKLKQSLSRYSPVELKPGEIALLKTTIPENAKDISYAISEEFGKAHGTWYGTLKLKN